jgi:2'-5' RNA ligase
VDQRCDPNGSRQRCFIALIPDARTLDALDAARTPWRRQRIDGVRWIARDHLHLTLRFIGALTGAQSHALRRDWGGLAPVLPLAAVNRIAFWPNPRRPRVLVLELDKEPALAALLERIDALLSVAGLPTQTRPFRPHLTLARFSDPFKNDTQPAMPERADVASVLDATLCRFDALQWISGTLTPRGARYTVLASTPVTAAAA